MSEHDHNTGVVKKRMGVILGASAVLVVGTLFAFTPKASASPHTFTADLEGSNEVPGPGDPKASARATVTVDDATNRVCVATLGNIWWPDTTEYHIHQGAAGATGGVVVDFMDRPDTCVTGDPTTVAGIIANPAGYYINVHTKNHPGGAARGEL
jgi:hypothetical protein